MGFGVSEYTLVFRRMVAAAEGEQQSEWQVTRPEPCARLGHPSRAVASPIAAVFAVPICSALALDDGSYEHFLRASGVLDACVALLATSAPLEDLEVAETARKRIQALVMAAEVAHIVEALSA